MTANIGPTDRLIRLVAGAGLVLWALVAGGWTALAWGALAVGAILVVTALTRVCPLYRLVGLSTCPLP
jgi:hypothetical protein